MPTFEHSHRSHHHQEDEGTFESYRRVREALDLLYSHLKFRHRIDCIHYTSSYRRILSEDIISKVNIPKNNISHMDGFAVKSSDISEASPDKPVILRVISEHGRTATIMGNRYKDTNKVTTSKKPLNYRLAYPIYTGNPLPTGSDTVIPIEEIGEIITTEKADLTQADNNNANNLRQIHNSKHTLLLSGSRTRIRRRRKYLQNTDRAKLSMILVYKPFQKGMFVYPKGANISRGQLVLSKGTRLRAQDIGLLALLQIFNVSVFAKPKISIIPTGSELTDNPAKIKFGKSLNTNSKVIARLIEEAGAISQDLGVTSDSINAIRYKIVYALKSGDMIITLGGSSVGRKDLVGTTIESVGKPGVICHGIRLDRGRVSGLAVIKGKPIVILPGPIHGALSGFIALAYPIIGSMTGSTKELFQVSAILTKDWQARKRFSNFKKILFVNLSEVHIDNSFHYNAEPLYGESESISILVKAHGYVMVPEDVTFMPAGQYVKVHVMPGLSF